MKSIAKKTKRVRQRLSEGERRSQIVKAAFSIALREGLEAVTARNVAKEAGLSQGLVFFHFSSAEGLMDALIAEVTEATLEAAESATSRGRGAAEGPFGAFLADRLVSLDQEGARRILELLVEAWVVGLRMPGARQSVRKAAARYRSALTPVAEGAIAAQPERFAGVAPSALASLALSVVLGTAIQAAIEPDRFDRAAVRTAVLAVFQPPKRRAPKMPAGPGHAGEPAKGRGEGGL